jgi:hypothetical protein
VVEQLQEQLQEKKSFITFVRATVVEGRRAESQQEVGGSAGDWLHRSTAGNRHRRR